MGLTNSGQPSTVLGSYLNAGVAQRKGQDAIAQSHIHYALDAVNWDQRRPAYAAVGWSVYLDDDVPFASAYVSTEAKRIVVGTETWDLLSYDSVAKYQLLDELKKGSDGIKLLPTETGPLLEALRSKARVEDAAVVQVVDQMTEFEEKAQKLLVEAASVNENGSRAHAQMFAVRFAQLQEDWVDLQGRMQRVDNIMNLLADVVAES